MKSKFKLLLAAAALLSISSSRAEMIPGVVPVPLGYCQIPAATLASATGLQSGCSGGIPAGANMILMQSEAQIIRWRDDGIAPTTAIGMQLLNTAAIPTTYNGTLSKMQFIDAVAGGILDVSFYKVP